MKAPTSSPLHILHAHTTMSVLDGASSVREYVDYASRNNLGACACTEHGYMLGDFDLFDAVKNQNDPSWCKKNAAHQGQVKPIPGCEFYLKPREGHVFAGKEYKYFHLTVWAMNKVGHQNLIALSSRSWEPGRVVTIWGHHRPVINWDDLALYNEGLVIGSGCIEGPIGKPFLSGEDSEAFLNAVTLWEIFKGRMFFELMPHAVDTNYIKDAVIKVQCQEDSSWLTLDPTDILITPEGEMTAEEASGLRRPSRIDAFRPPRRQGESSIDPQGDPVLVLPSSWMKDSRTFIGNECRYPTMSGGGRPHPCMQLYVNERVAAISKALGAPRLLTIDSHFVHPDSKKIQDILLQNGNKDGWRFSTVYYQMNTEQAYEAWVKNHSAIPGAEALFIEGVENNSALVDMVEPMKLTKEIHLPAVEYPADIRSQTENERLNELTLRYVAEHGRMPSDERQRVYLDRLVRELEVIANNPTLNFLPYFLTIHDICRYAREQGVLVGPGRGSAAGCLLAYLLKITHVDPIEEDLSFERFLSLGRIARGKFPDIDLDFGDAKLIADWLAQKHSDKFARICTTSTMKPKGAIRDVSRIVLDTQNKPDMAKRVNEVCESLPKVFPPNTEAKKWLYGYEYDGISKPGLIDDNPILQQFFKDFPEVKACVDLLLDVPRSLGKHASAYCLSDVSIGSLVPMCIISEEYCTQFTMGPVEKRGLIKFDLLSINTLNDITGCLKLIKERTGRDIDPWDKRSLPWDDALVFDRFCAGKNETVFQFNSAISTGICKSISPRSMLDIANVTANGRPGTMYAKMEDGETTLIDAWIQCRQGTRKVEYLHPVLEEILKPTDGIFTYQEQLMKATTVCCGYSEEEADYVREIIGKKKPDDLEKLLPPIRTELASRGWTDRQVASFISTYQAAAGYSFNKSHSICYALIGYVCQYLKTRYPLEWWNSVLSNSTNDDLKKVAQYCRDIVVAPNINTSLVDFYIIDDGLGKLVFPLGMVRNVKKAGAHIIAAREVIGEDGTKTDKPFESLQDFYVRAAGRNCNSKVVSSLIWAGAFDGICGVENIVDRNLIYRQYLTIKKDKKKLEVFVDLAEEDVLLRQTEMLAIGEANFVDLVKRKTGRNICDPGDVKKWAEKSVITTAGLAQRVVHTKTKKAPHKGMGIIDLNNESNTLTVMVFSDVYAAYKSILKENTVLIVTGKVNNYQGKLSLIADEITVFQSEESQESEEEI